MSSRWSDSAHTPLPDISDRTVQSLQEELIRTLRKDIHDFKAGRIESCLRNAERVLILRKAIHQLDGAASLYWSLRP